MTESYWPGVADSLLAALMIVMLLAFGGLVLFALNPTNSAVELTELRRAFGALQQKAAVLGAANEQLRAEVAQLKKDRPPPDPPIIQLDDAQNVNFNLGDAHISAPFSIQLRTQVFPSLRRILKDHPGVDTIEVIGHTDDSPVGSTRSNLDGCLALVIGGALDARALTAGSNADLGLMRAVAVQQEWRGWLAENQISLPRPIDLRCYSAANAIPPVLTADLSKKERSEKARRIEIRFTQLHHDRRSEGSPSP